MQKQSDVSMRFCASELVVCPKPAEMNRRKSASQLYARVSEALEQREDNRPEALIVDMCELDWISSAGLNALIRLQSNTRASGIRLHLTSINETIRDVLRLTRLERVFSIDSEPSESDQAIGNAEVRRA